MEQLRFNVTVIAQTVSTIEATATGSLYDVGDTITFNAGTFGGGSSALTLTLRADDLFTGVQKKYNGGRTINNNCSNFTQQQDLLM